MEGDLNQKLVVVAGGANIDIQGFSGKKVNLRDSNPGRIRLSAGGVGRNIAENLARLGVPVKMVSAVGGDAFGRTILDCCRDSGIDISEIEMLPGKNSSSYLVITDSDGDMLTAVSDMHILKEEGAAFIQRHQAAFSAADVIVIDPDLSEESLDEVTKTYGHKPIFADPISITYAGLLKQFLSRLYLVKCNKYEAGVLAGMKIEDCQGLTRAAEKILNQGVKKIVITFGEKGCLFADSDGFWSRYEPERIIEPVSATGAGDAFTAGMVYGHLLGLNAEKSLILSGRAAMMALKHENAVNPNISPEALGVI